MINVPSSQRTLILHGFFLLFKYRDFVYLSFPLIIKSSSTQIHILTRRFCYVSIKCTKSITMFYQKSEVMLAPNNILIVVTRKRGSSKYTSYEKCDYVYFAFAFLITMFWQVTGYISIQITINCAVWHRYLQRSEKGLYEFCLSASRN